MSERAVVVAPQEREWEGWPADQIAERGEVKWKTLLSSGLTASAEITLGLGRLRAGERLREHRHPRAEAYYVLAGTLALTVDGRRHDVGTGMAAYVPGGTPHALAAADAAEVRFLYAFAADGADEIAYEFGRA